MRLIFGILTGVIAGILLAPDSGKKTREKINNDFPKYKKQANDTLHDAVEKAKSAYNDLVKELGIATEKEDRNTSNKTKTQSNQGSAANKSTANTTKNDVSKNG